MAALKLRDRDAVVTREGLIFRVFGYSHMKNAYICDAEYAPASLFKSENPKALRSDGHSIYYKFYEDEGWRLIENNFPQYMVLHDALGVKVVGVKKTGISQVRRPHEMLTRLIATKLEDPLISATQKALRLVARRSGLSTEHFGVFGSMLHGFHHPLFSDIDLVIYGSKQAAKLYETLKELYGEASQFRNEFETDQSIKGKTWKFTNLSPQEYVWHQRRKLIYGLFKYEKGRTIKTEFEPVKHWDEINAEHSTGTRILQCGWVRMIAKITKDHDGPFIPSSYGIAPLKVLKGSKEASEAERIVSYLEEFRMQARRDEIVYVEGNLENVTNPQHGFHQIALTYCPRYYHQVLKVVT